MLTNGLDELTNMYGNSSSSAAKKRKSESSSSARDPKYRILDGQRVIDVHAGNSVNGLPAVLSQVAAVSENS